MKVVRFNRVIGLFLAGLCLIQAAYGDYLPIQNPGFEDQALADGAGTSVAINAWSKSGNSGIFNWATAVLPDESPEGQNTAYLNGGGEISQILLDDVEADSVYSLILEVGDRFNTGFGGYTIELLAGVSVISSIRHTDPAAPIPPDGGFVTVTVNYEVQPLDPVIGDSLRIRISSLGTQTEIDAVRLARLDAADSIENLTTNAKFASIQAAVDAAGNGEIIEIPPGTYHEHVDLKGKAITLRGRSGDPNDTIIDGRFIDTATGSAVYGSLDGTVVLCSNGEDADTVIESLTIRNGNGRYINSTNRQGAGMYINNASPAVNDCIFTDNIIGFGSFEGRGGGAYLIASATAFTNCRFIDNQATVYGGGVYLIGGSSITFSNCTFALNGAQTNGGAMNIVDSDVVITDCTFDTNLAVGSDGGAIANDQCNLTVTGCLFVENQAGDQGGALVNLSTDPKAVWIQDTDFVDNTALFDGGAIFNYNGSSPTMLRCDFTGNEATNDDGGAMYNLDDCSPLIQDCRFRLNWAASAGGAMLNVGGSSPVIVGSEFAGNRAGDGGAVFNADGADTHISYSTFIGNRAGISGGAVTNFNIEIQSRPVIDHCLFVGNSAEVTVAAVNNNDGADTTFLHCTFTANESPGAGGTVQIDGSDVEMHNCILYNNDTSSALVVNPNATADVTYCNIEGGYGGAGNIDADPLYAAAADGGTDGFGDDPATKPADEGANDVLGDQRLGAGSPSIDAADSLRSGAVDLDGKLRAVNDPDVADSGFGSVTYVDMGAYERQSGPCVPQIEGDVNCDGEVNLIDVSLLGQNWLSVL